MWTAHTHFCPTPLAAEPAAGYRAQFLSRQLFAAAEQGDAAGVRFALLCGADPNAACYRDLPLNAAARSGQAVCVAALLAAGADVQRQSEQEQTALGCAAADEHWECCVALLAAGASPPRPDIRGTTLAHLAALGGHAATLRLLLAAQPDAPLQKDESGDTPVHFAACRTSVEGLALLLTARPEAALVRNAMGLTPLGVSCHCDCPQAARCLLQLGALLPAEEVLGQLAGAAPWSEKWRDRLYAAFLSRQPLTAAQWAKVPPCSAAMGKALPAVLKRSEVEAGLLMQRLPLQLRSRLRTAALCLARSPALPALPTPIMWRVLALVVAG